MGRLKTRFKFYAREAKQWDDKAETLFYSNRVYETTDNFSRTYLGETLIVLFYSFYETL